METENWRKCAFKETKGCKKLFLKVFSYPSRLCYAVHSFTGFKVDVILIYIFIQGIFIHEGLGGE